MTREQLAALADVECASTGQCPPGRECLACRVLLLVAEVERLQSDIRPSHCQQPPQAHSPMVML